MAWEWKYYLERTPQEKVDGSGDIIHTVTARGSLDGGPFVETGMHTDIPIPADEIADVLAAGGTAAIVAAYTAALARNLGRTSEPVVGWTIPILELRMDNNIAATAQADAARAWIASVTGSYPVPIPY